MKKGFECLLSVLGLGKTGDIGCKKMINSLMMGKERGTCENKSGNALLFCVIIPSVLSETEIEYIIENKD